MTHVALILNLSKDFDRKIASGVAARARELDWTVYVEDEPSWRVPRFSQWRGAGIIANLDEESVAKALAGVGFPVVGVGGGYGGRRLLPDAPYIATDDAAIGRMAAEHLADCGFRRFAFCGYAPDRINGWSAARGEAFARAVRDVGGSFAEIQRRCDDPRLWDTMMGELAAWVRALPKPVGILAADDMRARHVLEGARMASCHVPAQVAVMGVDNDAIACGMTNPPLTSIAQDAERIGRAAIDTLGCMSRGRAVPARTVMPPLRLAMRASTDVLFDADPLVQSALVYIRRHFAAGIKSAEVASALGVSLAALNSHFHASRGESVAARIRHERMRFAMRLLDETDLPLKEIADQSGMGTGAYLCNVFRRSFGRSPNQWRAERALSGAHQPPAGGGRDLILADGVRWGSGGIPWGAGSIRGAPD